MLQLVLAMRRHEFLHEGKRWLDIKRYGIVIPRRLLGADGKPAKVTDWLTVDDPRRAVQIPQKAIDAGFTPNPRGNNGGQDRVCKPDVDEVESSALLKE